MEKNNKTVILHNSGLMEKKNTLVELSWYHAVEKGHRNPVAFQATEEDINKHIILWVHLELLQRNVTSLEWGYCARKEKSVLNWF